MIFPIWIENLSFSNGFSDEVGVKYVFAVDVLRPWKTHYITQAPYALMAVQKTWKGAQEHVIEGRCSEFTILMAMDSQSLEGRKLLQKIKSDIKSGSFLGLSTFKPCDKCPNQQINYVP